MYNHRDYKLLNNKKYVSKIYFKEINNFFNFFEKKFKTRILISLHPRTKNIGLYKKYFNQRKCLINKSHQYFHSIYLFGFVNLNNCCLMNDVMSIDHGELLCSEKL